MAIIMDKTTHSRLGKKVIVELLLVIAISQINRFNVLAYMFASLGIPESVAVPLMLLFGLAGIALFILFIVDTVRWFKNRRSYEH